MLPKIQTVSILDLSGDRDAAIALTERIAAARPDSTVVTLARASACAMAGRIEEARRLARSVLGSPTMFTRLAAEITLAATGDPAPLRQALEEWERAPAGGYLPAVPRAMAYAVLGETERVLTLLEEDERSGDRSLWAHYQVELFDNLRSEPRFRALLRNQGLPETLRRPLVSLPLRPERP
jgi:hypothetical protein